VLSNEFSEVEMLVSNMAKHVLAFGKSAEKSYSLPVRISGLWKKRGEKGRTCVSYPGVLDERVRMRVVEGGKG
jgi:hypothetical protein